MSFIDYLVPISVFAVAGVLGLGLLSMMRGGDGNTSRMLLRARVVLQFVAVIVIMGVIYVTGR